MSEPILNFVACPWCTSGNAADMWHWGKCPGAAERNRKAKDAVAEMFAALDAPVATATADQLRRKLLECEEALRTTEARAEKAEAELRTHLADVCATDLLPPMTTVLPDGTAQRVVPHGSWLTKRNPDGSLHCNHGAHVSCPLTHETEITYRLASFEETDR